MIGLVDEQIAIHGFVVRQVVQRGYEASVEVSEA